MYWHIGDTLNYISYFEQKKGIPSSEGTVRYNFKGGGGGGVQGNIFGRISFELWALQVPLMIGETFGEVPGPRRPTVSEPGPAQKLGVK